MSIEEKVSRLEGMLLTLAKASNYQFPADDWTAPSHNELSEFKSDLRGQFWRTYPQGDYLFEDFLVEILYKMKKAADK